MKNGTFKKAYLSGLSLAIALGLSQSAIAVNHFSSFRGEHVPGELIVKLADRGNGLNAQFSAISAIERALGSDSILSLHPLATNKSYYIFRLSKDVQLKDAIASLKSEPYVEYAEPNYIFHAYDDGVPNDPDFGKTWGFRNTGQTDKDGQVGLAGSDVHVVPVWQEGLHGSRKVIVAVIDTGIQWDHPDIAANLYTNPGETDNGKDNDGNGFVADIHGWNFADNNNNSRDDYKHGTHVAGTIGAVGNNGVGVAGINWEVSLMPVKFLNASGSGTLEGAVNAINYATMMKAQIMSNSWGGGSFTRSLFDAIKKAKDAGILFVAAAGNDGTDNDSTPSYPASYDIDNVISVAATDNRDQLAGFSNYGKKSVHVAAPGVNVYSTSINSTYEILSGTSMATPHVSGIAALVLSGNLGLGYQEIKDRLIRTSDPLRDLSGRVLAKGRVNAYNAVHNIVPASSEPDPSLWKSVPWNLESPHPYTDNMNEKHTIHFPGAKYLRVHFQKIDTEANYDKVTVLEPTGQNEGTRTVDQLSGSLTDVYSQYIVGDTAIIQLTSDSANTAWGFKIDAIQVITGKNE